MNILITGYLNSIATGLVEKLSREKRNKIILVDKNAGFFKDKTKNIVTHSVDLTDPLFKDIINSYDLDTIIFIPLREEQLLIGVDQLSGHLLDGMINILNYCKNKPDIWFILISSTEVYEKVEIKQTNKLQETALNKNILLTCEQYCQYYNYFYNLNTSIIRVPFVYGPDETNSFLYDLITNCLQKDEVFIPASKDTLCSFIHTKDVADFIQRLLDEEYYHEYKVFNLPSSDNFTFMILTQELNKYFPKVRFTFQEDKKISTKTLDGILSKQEFDWLPSYRLRENLNSLIKIINKEPTVNLTTLDKIKQKIKTCPNLIKWIELFLGAAIMQLFIFITNTFVQFKYVDFRLLYVILIGSVYGLRFALIAAILAGISNLYSWYQLGLDWELLIYHVENWFPFALYLIAGSITGYVWDKKENEINFTKDQINLMQDKYSFLYNLFNDIRGTKDQLREQLMGYRDSYGRIYSITQELDTLNANDVFLKALDILEDVMDNKNIAIYTLDQTARFGRLEVSSAKLSKKISKSLNLSNFPLATEIFKNGGIFENQALLPNYPSLIAPIIKDETALGMICVWEREFDQFSIYYQNLFKIVSGLIESSLVHASLFRDANLEKWYLPSTRILKPQVFKEILRIKTEMQNKKITSYQILIINKGILDWKLFYRILEKGIRANDYVGLLHDDDPHCYVLLSQAEKTNVEMIISRLQELDLKCDIVESSKISYG